MAVTTSEEPKPETMPQEKPDWRVRLRSAYENLSPLTKEEAELINKSVMEARERSIGENMPVHDVWIAAVARVNGATVVTHDGHFKHVANLAVVDWTVP